jgi:hypothetical protein
VTKSSRPSAKACSTSLMIARRILGYTSRELK